MYAISPAHAIHAHRQFNKPDCGGVPLCILRPADCRWSAHGLSGNRRISAPLPGPQKIRSRGWCKRAWPACFCLRRRRGFWPCTITKFAKKKDRRGRIFLCGRVEGEQKMDTTADRLEPIATPQTPVSPEKHARPEHSVDKFADARRAKKKHRRARHRAKLRRSHTNG